MWNGDTINRSSSCEAFINGEREGISSQQSAESLNGAYSELGYRNGPLVELAEEAITREIKLLRENYEHYSKLREEGEIVGPRKKLMCCRMHEHVVLQRILTLNLGVEALHW